MLRTIPDPAGALHSSRPLAPGDIDQLAEWLCRLSLYQRYGFQPTIFAKSLEEALSAGDWLQVRTVGKQTCAFAWCQEHGAFGRSPYLRLIAVRAGYQRRGIGPRIAAPGGILGSAVPHLAHVTCLRLQPFRPAILPP